MMARKTKARGSGEGAGEVTGYAPPQWSFPVEYVRELREAARAIARARRAAKKAKARRRYQQTHRARR